MLRQALVHVTPDLVRGKLAYCLHDVRRPPAGKLRHPYLTPSARYSTQSDWENFFMGVALLAEDPSQAHHLKHWVLNVIENADDDGRVAGCLTPTGESSSSHHMKPFLAQGAYLATKHLDDVAWLRPFWGALVRIVMYRTRRMWTPEYGLGMWHDSTESGANTNVALLEYPRGSVLATDLNSFLYLEFKALELLAGHLRLSVEAQEFGDRAWAIRDAMLRHLWSPYDDIFTNLFTASGRPVRRITYSSFVPLWAGIAPYDDGRRSIETYLLNPEHMAGPWGIRTLSKQDPTYNNVCMERPLSNWQGPVWPIANYMYMHALLRYGFKREAVQLAQTISALVMRDIDTSGGMHENYDAESGEPLAAPDFVGWNLLVRNMIYEAETETNPFDIV